MQKRWERSSDAIAALCEHCGSGSWLARALQTALLLLRLGLEGAGPGTMRRQPDGPTDGCREDTQLPEDCGVLKLITRLAPLCLQNSQRSISWLQRLVEEEFVESVDELEKVVAVMLVCTRFVVDACDCMVLHPEDWEIASCTSLSRVLPLMECCLPTLDSALVLSNVARKLQVHLFRKTCRFLRAHLCADIVRWSRQNPRHTILWSRSLERTRLPWGVCRAYARGWWISTCQRLRAECNRRW